MRVVVALWLTVVSHAQQPHPLDRVHSAYESGDPAGALTHLRHFLSSEQFRDLPAGDRVRLHANLGVLAHEVGDYRQAEAAYRRASQVCQAEKAGDELILSIANDLAGLHLEWGDLEKTAAELAKQANLDLSRFPGDHPEILRRWANLGSLEYARGKHQLAIEWNRKALLGWTRRNDLNSMQATIAQTTLGLALMEAGQHKEAVSVLEESLKGVESSAAYLQSRLPVALSNLGRAKALNGQVAEARVLFKRSVEDALARLGPSHPVTGSVLLHRSDFLAKWGDKKESKRIRQQAWATLDAVRRSQGLSATIDANALRSRPR